MTFEAEEREEAPHKQISLATQIALTIHAYDVPKHSLPLDTSQNFLFKQLEILLRTAYGFPSRMCAFMNMIKYVTFCVWHVWFVLPAPYHSQDKVLLEPGERERENESTLASN